MSRRKIYLHYESKGAGGGMTTAFAVQEDTNLSTVMQEFLAKLSTHLGRPVALEDCAMHTEDGTAIKSTAKKLIVHNVLDDDQCDLFVTVKKGLSNNNNNNNNNNKTTASTVSTTSNAASPAMTPTPSSSSSSSSSKAVSSSAAPNSSAKAAKSALDLKREEVARHVSQVKTLEQLMRVKQFKRAKEFTLALMTHNISLPLGSTALYALKCQMEIDLYCKRYENVVEYARQLRSSPISPSPSPSPSSSSSSATTAMTTVSSLYTLSGNPYFFDIIAMEGIALQRLRLHQQATLCFEPISRFWKDGSPASAQQLPAYVQSEEFFLHIVALHAQSVFALESHAEAAGMLNAVMEMKQADAHLGVLCAYATFTLRFHKYGDAINAILKAVAVVGTKQPKYALSAAQQQSLNKLKGIDNQDKQDKEEHASYLADGPQRVKEVVTELLSSRDGWDGMLRTFPPHSRGTAEVYAYLATTVKDLSAIDVCLRLYELALQAHPNHANLTLNAAHAHEVKLDYDAALELLQVFFAKNLKLSLGRESGAPYTLSCAQIVDAMKRETPKSSDAGVRHRNELNDHHDLETSQKDNFVKSNARTSRFQTHRMLWMERDDRQYCVVQSASSSIEDNEKSAHENKAAVQSHDFSILFTERELDLLALFATTAKLLFLCGSLSKLPGLIQSVEALRRLSKAPLHLTNIRNELAYYTHIVQILFQRNHAGSYGIPAHINAFADPLTCEEPLFVEARRRPIYVCGDSHCLSSAWSTISVRGERRLLYPRLVTGIKQFHLREESKFYPKENFYQAIASIPSQSEVIFVIGEIDCREGILMAVERDIYQTVEEGMQTTIAHFTKVLTHLKTTKRFTIYIHPVPPVLNETRPIVTLFNQLFKQAINDLNDEQITWLNFEKDLAETSGSGVSIKSCYKHDGTHLSPKYVELIERSLNPL